MGDIHLTHYFITQVIPQYRLTPAQAWLVAVARDLAYLNWRTGERRETVTFKGGYQEMAALMGSSRPKTVQAWLNPDWKSQQRGGDLSIFLQELELPDQGYSDLRTDTCHAPSGCYWTSRWTQMEVIRQAQMEVIGWTQMEAIASRKWKY